MLSWKTIVITLILSLTGALIVQYWNDGPADRTSPGETDTSAGPSRGEAAIPAVERPPVKPATGAPTNPVTSPTRTPDDGTRRTAGSQSPAFASADRFAPLSGHSGGTPPTQPYLEDDRNLAREMAEAGDPPSPSPMTPEQRALLSEPGVDLEQEGLVDRSGDFVDWFPDRAEFLFGGDGDP